MLSLEGGLYNGKFNLLKSQVLRLSLSLCSNLVNVFEGAIKVNGLQEMVHCSHRSRLQSLGLLKS